MFTAFRMTLPHLRQLGGVEGRGSAHQSRPEPPVDERNLAADEATNQNMS
jgi:hypothetical protein